MTGTSRSGRVARNTGIMFCRMLLMAGIGLFTSREVLRILGVEDFGVYNLVGTIVVMFSFLQTALNNANTRFITYNLGSGNTADMRNTFSMSVNTELLLAGIIFVLSEAVGPWFIETKLSLPEGRTAAAHWVYQISLLNLMLNIIRTPYSATIVAHERFDFFAYNSIIEALGKLGSVYMLIVVGGDKLITYALLQMAVSLFVFGWMLVYCLRNFEETHYRRYWDKSQLKKLTNYSGFSMLVNMADVAVLQSLGIFFNLFSGVVANAALGVANRVNGQLTAFLGNFSQSYSPQVIKSYAAGDRQYFMNLLFSAGKFSYFLYFAVAFPIMLNIDCILALWLHEVPADAGLYLCLIIGYVIFDSFSTPLVSAVHATGNLKVHQIMIGSIKILNIPLSYCLLKNGCPVYSALIVYAVLNFVCSVARVWWLTRLIHLDARAYVREVAVKMLLVTVVSVPVPVMIHRVMTDGLLAVPVTSVVFFLIYFPLIYIYACNQKEKELVRKALKRIRRRK